MEESIEDYLSRNEAWKKFIDAKDSVLEKAEIMSITITNWVQQGNKVFFDMTLIYTAGHYLRREKKESAIAVLDDKGNIIDVYPQIH